MNGSDYFNQSGVGNIGSLGAIQAQAAQHYWQGQLAAPKSIMQQLRDKAEELKANLAKCDEWKRELAQCERMIAAAEEPKSDG